MASSVCNTAVYFVQSQTTGLIKIGTSFHVRSRLKQLRYETKGDALVLLATIPGGVTLERKLHSHFRDTREHGEWFKPTAELVTLIASIVIGRPVFGLPEIPEGWADLHCNAPAAHKVAS